MSSSRPSIVGLGSRPANDADLFRTRILLILPLKSLVRHIESVLVALAQHSRNATGICPDERADEWKTATGERRHEHSRDRK